MKKNEKQKVLICLPSFNEGKVLENFLKELKKKKLYSLDKIAKLA